MARLGVYMQHCHSWCVGKLIVLRCVRDMLLLCSLWPPHACAPQPITAMRHSLAKPQASGVHVALDRLPPPRLAAPRHHAANTVTATGPRPSPRASTTPAVAGPWRGSSTALPTLIHGPAGGNGAVGSETEKHGTDREKGPGEDRKMRERRTDGRTQRQTHRRTRRKAESLSAKLVRKVRKTLSWAPVSGSVHRNLQQLLLRQTEKQQWRDQS